MRKKILAIMSIAAVAALGLGGAPASATTAQDSPAASSASSSNDFPVPSSREELQKQVDEVLATKGGQQTSVNEISWTYPNGGEVRLLFPVPKQMEAEAREARKRSLAPNAAAAVSYSFGCPTGTFSSERWSCVYENANFNGVSRSGEGPGNGRILQFRDTGIVQRLSDWNFADQASSAFNNRAGGFMLMKNNSGCGGGNQRIIGVNSGLGGLGDFNDAVKRIYIAPDGQTPTCG